MSILNQRPEPGLHAEVALLQGMDVAFVEKDWFVVQLIRSLATTQLPGFAFIFSGGNCLSKAYSLLQRFSEDVDFRVQTVQAAPSRTALSAFKREVIAVLRAQG